MKLKKVWYIKHPTRGYYSLAGWHLSKEHAKAFLKGSDARRYSYDVLQSNYQENLDIEPNFLSLKQLQYKTH